MELDRMLKKVDKPVRYTGGEINMCKKDLNGIKFLPWITGSRSLL